MGQVSNLEKPAKPQRSRESGYNEEPALEGGDPSSLPPSKRDPSPSQPQPSPAPPPPTAGGALQLRLATWSLLVFATFWGVLARLGLIWVGGFAGREVFVSVWPQMVGCLVMGFSTERKKTFESIWPPVFVMLGTGFCGSLTTFSTWMDAVFAAFANLDAPGYGRFSAFISGVAVTLITLAASWCSLLLGTHLHAAAPDFLSRLEPTSNSRPRLPLRLVCLVLGPLFYIGVILLFALGPHTWRHEVTFALLLGPPGTLLRFELSKYLNPISPRFPLGTLAANSIAVLVFAITALLQRGEGLTGNRCAVLKGVQDGFCGSLSTVSTFVVELRTLGRREGWAYFTASWVMGQLLFVLVLGSWVWSGDRGGVCSA